jgi:hypothetical protein
VDTDEQKIRAIVRDEMQKSRARRRGSRAEERPLASSLRAALDGQRAPTEVTTRELLVLAGHDPGTATRGDFTLAGTVLREAGWTVVRRRAAWPRERVYSKSTARAA